MPSTPAFSVAVAAVHADPILASANTPIVVANGSAIPGLIGESQKWFKQAPPYVAWIPKPMGDRFDLERGSRGASPPKAAGTTPQWIMTRWCAARLYINCLQQPGQGANQGPADFDTMEVTVNAFLAALHRQLRGSYELGPGGIEETQGTELMKDRKVYVLDLWISTPITEMPTEATTAQILSVPITAGINTPTNPPQ